MNLHRLLLPIAVALTGIATLSALAAAPKPSEQSRREGQELAAQLRALRPAQDLDVQGVLRRRDEDGRRSRTPFRYRVILHDQGWEDVYETQPPNPADARKLTVIRSGTEPTRYLLSASSGADTNAPVVREYLGDAAMISFADSDFWLADLGLEFLQWPEQRLVEEAKIRMRKGRPCKVLESVNPSPGAQGYTRVRAWIDAEQGGVILADAYGPDNKLLKTFEVGGVTKVKSPDGKESRWEVRDIGMRNVRTDRETVFEFKYEWDDRGPAGAEH